MQTPSPLWDRYRQYLCRADRIGSDARHQPHEFRAGLPRAHGAGHPGAPIAPWTHSSAAPSPIRTRTAWWAITGCARRNWRPPPKSRRRSTSTAGGHPASSPRPCTRARSSRHRSRGSRTCSASASAARRWARCSWPTRWAIRAATAWPSHFIDNTDPDGIARVLSALREAAWRETLVHRHQQERRHARNAQRHAAAGGCLPRAPASISRATPWRSPWPGSQLDQQADAEGWLARFPMWDWVGGRTSELRPSACCRRRSRGSTSTPCWPGPRPATRPPGCTIRGQPRRAAGPDVVSRHRRQGTQGHGRAPVQGPPAAVQPLPAAAGDGVAGQAARSRRASASTRASRSTATRAPPTSMPTCSSCATA